MQNPTNFVPERPTAPQSSSAEASPEALPLASPETPAAFEKEPQPAASAGQGMVLPPVQVPQPAAAVSDDSVSASDSGQTDDVDLPADDVDLIEKVWVDKAKVIITQTKDDPHAQEAGFEQLQREYQRRRYGRDIKAA